MKRLYAPLYRVVFQMVPCREDTEEILQETFFRFYKALKRVHEGEDPFPFLRTVATRCTYTHLKRRREPHLSLDDLPEELPSLDVAGRELGVADLYLWAETLPPKRRLVFLLREVEGRTTAEVGGLLKMREATVRRHASMALTAFRERFGGGGE